MGARSRKKHRNQRRRESKQGNAHDTNISQESFPNVNTNTVNDNEEQHEEELKSQLPFCVHTLVISTDFAELEEACNDLISYITQFINSTDIALSSHRRSHALHHRQRFFKTLVNSHIPQRLMSLMSLQYQVPPPHHLHQTEEDRKSCPNETHSVEGAAFIKEALYTQIAACSALRTLLNNGDHTDCDDDEDDGNESENVIVDVLINAGNNKNNNNITSNNINSNSCSAFTVCLLELVQSVWKDVEQSAQYYALHGTRSNVAKCDVNNNNSNNMESMEFTLDKEEEKKKQWEEEEKKIDEEIKTKAHQSKSTEEDDDNEIQKESNKYDQKHKLEEQEEEEEEEQQQQDKREQSSQEMTLGTKQNVKTANKLNFYFVHLRFFDELIQLLTVFVDSSNIIASYLSNNQFMEFLLHTLQIAFINVFKYVQEYQNCYKVSVQGTPHDSVSNHANVNKTTEESYKVAELYASVAIAISELLNAIAASDHVKPQHFHNLFTAAFTINYDNNMSVNVKHATNLNISCTIPTPSSSSLSSFSPPLVEFVKHAIHATELIEWQHTAEFHANLHESVMQLQLESANNSDKLTRCMDDAKVEMLLYMLCEATINIQTTLMSVVTDVSNTTTNESITPALINLMLPLITVLLTQLRPMEQWQQVLPLFSQACQIGDEEANQLIKLIKHRLHSVLLSLKMFHTIVNTICERNESNEDDEVAFRANPLSADLYKAHSLVAFAETLKNVLWLHSTHNRNTTMLPSIKQAQAALTAAIDSNPEASFIQYMLLNIEGVVWDVASTLLLMIPMQNETMKYDQNIWQAMITCVQDKYKLLLTSDMDESDGDDEESNDNNHKTGTKSNTPENEEKEWKINNAKSKSMVCSSPATRHVLWQHIESIVQLLWTLLRKDIKIVSSSSSSSSSSNSNTHHLIHVKLTDLKLLLALSHFSTHHSRYSSTRLRQALIGTLSLLSKLLDTVESTRPVVECACSVLLHSHVETNTHYSHNHQNNCASVQSTYTPLLKLGDGIVEVARVPSTVGKSRQEWVSLLNAVDAVVSLRCEAANALIDLFIDERFDATLYGPLQIQQLLRQFLAELRVFIKKRVQLSNMAKRNYRLDLEIANLEQWQELEENLCGFVQYKQQHGFA